MSGMDLFFKGSSTIAQSIFEGILGYDWEENYDKVLNDKLEGIGRLNDPMMPNRKVLTISLLSSRDSYGTNQYPFSVSQLIFAYQDSLNAGELCCHHAMIKNGVSRACNKDMDAILRKLLAYRGVKLDG